MSGRKSNLRQYRTITDGNMGSATLTSLVTNIQRLDNIGIQINFAGTPTGTFDVQVSADYAQDEFGNVTNVGNWISLDLTPSPAASGSASQIYIDIAGLSAPWIRVKYTRTSGTGTLNTYVTGKML